MLTPQDVRSVQFEKNLRAKASMDAQRGSFIKESSYKFTFVLV